MTQRVDVNYGGGSGQWYAGRVVGTSGGTFEVLYDDGETEQGVTEDNLRPLQELVVHAGMRVRGRFGGGLLYFPAVVVRVDPGRGIDLDYADGDSEFSVPVTMLAPEAGISEGAQVEARYGGGEDWFLAVVVHATDTGFDLQYDDGDFESNVPEEWIRLHEHGAH